MTYSIDLRKKALAYIEKGGSKETVSQVFGITIRTLSNWVKRKEQGCLPPSIKQRTPHKIDNEKLKLFIKDNPDAYLREIADSFGVTPVAVFYACKRLKITLKKRHLFTKKGMKKNVRNLNKS